MCMKRAVLVVEALYMFGKTVLTEERHTLFFIAGPELLGNFLFSDEDKPFK